MKKLLLFILCALLLLCCCACSPAKDVLSAPNTSPSPTPAAEPENTPAPSDIPIPEETQAVSSAMPRTLVCIGDSIASGFALPPVGAQRYSALLCDMLSNDSEHWNEYNYAVPGHTSSDMISLLNEGHAPELENADIITVCIGANNVLMPAQTFLMKYGSYTFGIQSGIDSGLTGSDIRDAYNAFRAAAESGAETLRSDLAAALEFIRGANPDALVILMTVYNPYKTNKTEIDISGLPIPMNVMSDTFVTMINEVIISEAETLGYEIADVYSAFEPIEEYLINGDGADSFLADPHPNSAGHKLIAETHYSIIAAAA